MKFKRLIIYFSIIIFFIILAYYKTDIQGSSEVKYEHEEAFVERVIDGDTLIYSINNVNYTCRLLGINTPEKNRPYYNQAKEFLKQIENKTVYILRDKTDIDKYQRKLRYVFYNNRNLNLELLEQGLGTAYMIEELKYKEQFLRAQILAQNSEVNLWKKSDTLCSQCIILRELNSEQEFFILENICNQDCNLEGWYVKDSGRNTFNLETLTANHQQLINSTKSIWNNYHDEFFLRDNNGLLVIYYSY